MKTIYKKFLPFIASTITLAINHTTSYSQIDTSNHNLLIQINKEFKLHNIIAEENLKTYELEIYRKVKEEPKPLELKIQNMVLESRKKSKEVKNTIHIIKNELEQNPQKKNQILYNNVYVLKRQLDELLNLLVNQYNDFTNKGIRYRENLSLPEQLFNDLDFKLSSEKYLKKNFPDNNTQIFHLLQLICIESRILKLEEYFLTEYAKMIGAFECPPQEVVEITCDSIMKNRMNCLLVAMGDSLREHGFKVYNYNFYKNIKESKIILDVSQGIKKEDILNHSLKIMVEADYISSIYPGNKKFKVHAAQILLLRQNKVIKGPIYEFADVNGNLELFHEFSSALPGDLVQIVIFQIKDPSAWDPINTRPFIIMIPVK
ncbi:MAG: hypothetical protein K2X86_09190 [Cytophagaceae bacterium]|nr:hypothetical protein [Cytophagaceae bacterium]